MPRNPGRSDKGWGPGSGKVSHHPTPAPSPGTSRPSDEIAVDADRRIPNGQPSRTLRRSVYGTVASSTIHGASDRFFLVIDSKQFREEGEFEAGLDEMMDFLRGQVPADAAQPVLVLGDPEYAEEETRLRCGMQIPRTLATQFCGVCRESAAAHILEG